MKIQPIVEGHGEVEAVPVLLRRLINEAGLFNIDVLRPIRQKRSQLVRKSSLQRAVQLACLRQDCSSILILFDADDDCPKEHVSEIQQWANEISGLVPCAVVMAVKEYEAWFLSTMESLRGKTGIKDDAASSDSPETVKGAKEAIERQMKRGFSYMETTNQAALTAIFDMHMAFRRCRSFRKLVTSFGEIVRSAGARLSSWPPPDWMQENL